MKNEIDYISWVDYQQLRFDDDGVKTFKKNKITNSCCSVVLNNLQIKHTRIFGFKINDSFVYIWFKKRLNVDDGNVVRIDLKSFILKISKRNLLVEKKFSKKSKKK